jgi:hypothetical protein
MKYLQLIFILMMFCNIYAQEPTNSAAKIYYKGILKHFEKLNTIDISSDVKQFNYEIEKAEEKLELLKKSDKTYDVSNLASQISNYKNKGGAESISQNSSKEDAAKLIKEMETVFKAPSPNEFNVNNGGISNAKQTYEAYVLLCSNFIATDAKSRISNAKKINRYRDCQGLTEEKSGFEVRAKQIKAEFNKSISQENSLTHYYLAKKYMTYWETAKNCMPDEILYAQNYTIASNLVSEMGDADKAKSKADGNLKERLSNVKIPDAVRKDANIEAIFKKAFANEGWNETILKINLRDNDWTIVKNQYTGAIIGRSQSAAIVSKNGKGDCILYSFSIMQDYTGNAYQANAHRTSHNANPIACENVNK